MTEIVALEALAARVTPGQSLAIPVDGSGVAMTATAALLEAGVGLTTVRDVARSAGGFVRVESEPGHGTCFRV